MSFLRQLGALLRKDILIRKFKRHYILAVLELAFPALIWGALLLVWGQVGVAFSTQGRGGDAESYSPLRISGVEDITRDWSPRTRVYYTPDTVYSRNITNNIFTMFSTAPKGFDDEAAMMNALTKESNSDVLALQFAPKEINNQLSYTMRWPKWLDMRTDTIFPEGSKPRIAGGSGFDYGEKQYLWPLMYAIFLEHLSFFELGPVDMPTLQPLPTPAYKGLLGESLFGYLATVISGLIFGTFIIFSSCYSKNIMQDKETRLRELLRMMGLTDSVYWTNAFLVGLLNASPLCLMVMVALCVNFKITSVLRADALLIFIVVLFYAIGIILLTLLISVLVKSAKLGSALLLLAQTAGLIVVIVLDPPSSTSYLLLSAFVKLATSMFSPCGIYWAFKLIMAWEKRELGATWSNLFDAAIEEDNITLGGILLAMLSSWMLWIIVILYLDAVVPWQYGMPKHPLFFARYSCWFPGRDGTHAVDSERSCDGGYTDGDMVENTKGAKAVIRLDRITHNFGALRAVDELSLELYENQITVLLGHNGAGKTTAMNILTGLFPPNRGEIYINGHDVRKNTKKAREGVGLCPQHNVLFDDLTVGEHLDFFAMLKSSNASGSEVRDLLSKLELAEKTSTLSKSLSGGMKRKLSLANAMVGGSPILILDEPSSGLDPEARRVVWDLLQQERTRRTVLMTTHYMEEADVLGDRIAFLAKGKLMCAGSPMFLKRKFETGYKLRITKVDQGLDPEPIIAMIKSLLPQTAENVHLVSDMSYEILINIGFPGSTQMINLFRHLEASQQQLGIESLGTSVTTMEDVFLKVGQREEDLASSEQRNNEQTAVNVFESFPKFQRLSGPSLILRQMSALFVMRFHSLRRDAKIIAYMTVLPLIFSFLLALISLPGDGIIRSRAITYDVNKLLNSPQGFIAGKTPDKMAEAFENRLKNANVEFISLPELGSKDQVDADFLERAGLNPTSYKTHTYAGLLKGSNSIYFNGQPYHVGAAALADWQGARLTELTGEQSQVVITNHPLDSKSYYPPVQSKVDGMRILTVLLISLVFSFVSCAVIITPIQERVRKSKLIQIMSGVRPEVYIGSNFIFDGISMFICLILCFIILLCFNPMGGLTSMGETIPAFLVIFLLYIFASTPWAYVLSYLFASSTSGFSVYLALNVVVVFIASLVFGTIERVLGGIGNRADTYLNVLSFVPVFSASWSFATTFRNGCAKTVFDGRKAEEICSSYSVSSSPGIFAFCERDSSGWTYKEHSAFNMNLYTGIGFQLVALTAMGLFGSVLLMFVEMNSRRFAHVADSISIKKLLSCCRKPAKDRNLGEVIEDSAVQAERQFVNDVVADNKIQSYALIAKDVTKYYGSIKAVNNISFHVEKNECFGLLGVNGAGKTTTFSMLTGDYMMSKGNSYIQHTNVSSQLKSYQEYIGYCPQFDALADTLTGREMLSLFCGLRGVPRHQVETMINFMTAMSDLNPHIDKLTQTYSGGNKRKLSLAIAMIGNPPLLFLDEPSAGVDPGARRKIWATLTRAQKELNSSVVLTSHSMDECEALCHRLVIMLRGTFRCMGSSQQIKSRYGQGFTILIKTEATEDDQQEAVRNAMSHLFNGRCELKDSYQCLLQFHVNDTSLRWSEVFERIENLRENPDFKLEDVQVSDTTLEQVFLNFAREDSPR